MKDLLKSNKLKTDNRYVKIMKRKFVGKISFKLKDITNSFC